MTETANIAAGPPAHVRARRQENQERNAALPVLCELTQLTGSLAGRPVVVVGAGPSVGQGIKVLMTLPAPVAIVAVDRAFPYLQDRGLTPGVVVMTDDQAETQDFFRGRDLSKTLLIANTTANHGSAAMFPRRVFYRVAREQGGGPAPYPRELDLWPKTSKMTLTLGFVGNEALMVAHLLGGRPLVLIGYDLHSNLGMDALEAFLRSVWLPIARHKEPGLEIWNASPGSAWTEGIRAVHPSDLPHLFFPETIPAPSRANP